MKRLQGRTALITAAASGMGRASAERFAAEGAHVVVSDIDGDGAAEVVETIEADGGSAEAVSCDVRDLDALKAMVDGIERDHGALHVLFNHAGIPGAGGGDSGLDLELDAWDTVMDINVRSAFYLTGYALPLLRRAGNGANILFTASVSGIVGSPLSPVYALTKGGIVLLMRSLAIKLGPEGIRSNAICPAMIETPMLSAFFGRDTGADIEDLKAAYKGNVPLSRAAHPSEMAAAAAFLASDDASWVTGVALPVDGGFLAQ
jgi:NAD(P)-dependent dehydrogenase (short-subunit alcohol dehydrogenase family)